MNTDAHPIPVSADAETVAGLLPAPVRVLCLSPQASGLPRALAERGHDVTAADPAAGPPTAADPPGPAFGAVVAHEAVPPLDLLGLLNRAYDRLHADGRLVFLGPVGLSRADEGRDPLPLLRTVLAQAARCGFRLVDQRDLPAPPGAKPRQGRALLAFDKGPAPRWRLAVATAADSPAIRALFKTVFSHDMSEALWQWKYGEGRGFAILAWRGSELAAHYGGIARDALLRGRPFQAEAIADVMVAPGERGLLTRKGPFFLTAVTFQECCMGLGGDSLIGFGFPNRRAMQVAERQGLYAEVGRMAEVRWRTVRLWPWPALRARALERDAPEPDRAAVDALWDRMVADLRDGIVGLRDWARVRHRYLSHPEFQYDVLLVSDRGGVPLGVVVLRRAESRCLLLDVIGPLANLRRLIAAARRAARQAGMPELYAWVSQPHAHRFARTGGRVAELDVSVPVNAWSPGPDPAGLRDAWWLMTGDTDFL